jgi:flagellar hook-basal body complex protein FliE
VAEIFQDKIPHEEIIQRQSTIKYVQAARMAHSGASIEEIVKEVGLPQSEVEFIAKVNKDQLMFSEEQLPGWVQGVRSDSTISSQASERPSSAEEVVDRASEFIPIQDFSKVFQVPQEDFSSLKKLGDEFRQACDDYDKKNEEASNSMSFESAREVKDTVARKAEEVSAAVSEAVEESQLLKAAKAMRDKVLRSAEEIVSSTAEHVVEPLEPNPTSSRVSVKEVGANAKKGENESEKAVFVPDSYIKKNLGVNRNEVSEVRADQVRKVIFPDISGDIDMNKDLG